MKFFIVFALLVAAASARFVIPVAVADEAAEIDDILAIINNPSTDPATAAALQDLLNDILGVAESPIHVGPAIVEQTEDSPIHVGPAIVDEADLIDVVDVGPAIVDEADLIDVVDVGPAIIDQPAPSSSPLIQVIINVKSGAQVGPNPVEVIDASPVITPEESLTLPGPGFIGY